MQLEFLRIIPNTKTEGFFRLNIMLDIESRVSLIVMICRREKSNNLHKINQVIALSTEIQCRFHGQQEHRITSIEQINMDMKHMVLMSLISQSKLSR